MEKYNTIGQFLSQECANTPIHGIFFEHFKIELNTPISYAIELIADSEYCLTVVTNPAKSFKCNFSHQKSQIYKPNDKLSPPISDIRTEIRDIRGRLECRGELFQVQSTSTSFTRLENFRPISPKDKIGSGANGVVYKVTSKTGEMYALKKLWDCTKLGTLGAQFVEYQIPYYFPHDNICPVYSHFKAPTILPADAETAYGLGYTTYLVLLLLDKTLAQLVHERALDEAEILTILLQVCKAIAHLQEHRFIHRDIKLQDILITKDKVFLADFGCASMSDSSVSNGYPLGRPPEVFQESYDAFNYDMWTIGCLCYEIIGLKNPNPVVTGENIPPFPAKYPKLAQFSAHCLIVDPFKRITGALAVELLSHLLWPLADPVFELKHLVDVLSPFDFGYFPLTELELQSEYMLSRFGYTVSTFRTSNNSILKLIAKADEMGLCLEDVFAWLESRNLGDKIDVGTMLDSVNERPATESPNPSQFIPISHSISLGKIELSVSFWKKKVAERNAQDSVLEHKFLDFTVLENIGCSKTKKGQYGANAMVYLVEHKKTQALFVMKVLYNYCANSSLDILQLYKNEYELELRSPFTAPVLSAFVDFIYPILLPHWSTDEYCIPERLGGQGMDKTLYVILPHFSCNLAAYLRNNVHLSERDRLHILLQIVYGVSVCVQAGVIHQDMKLDNILINVCSSIPEAVICDFGCMLQVDCITEVPTIVLRNNPAGNPFNRAPELKMPDKKVAKANHSFDFSNPNVKKDSQIPQYVDCSKADLYSAGLMGMEIFIYPNKIEMVQNIPNFPEEYDPDIRKVLDTMIRTNPEHRPSSFEAILLLQILLYGPPKKILKERNMALVCKWRDCVALFDVVNDPLLAMYLSYLKEPYIISLFDVFHKYLLPK